MDIIQSFLKGNKKDLFLVAIILECIFVFAYVICSFVVADTANAGFNCVLTGFLNVAFIGGSYYVINNSKAPIAVGFLIGSSGTMTFLNFITGIFWGELSRCDKSLKAAQYSCTNPTAYGAVAAFAILLFLTQLAFTVGLVLYRNDFINEAGLYDESSSANGHHSEGFVYKAPSLNVSGMNPPLSADL